MVVSHASHVPRPLFIFVGVGVFRAWKEARVVASFTVALYMSQLSFRLQDDQNMPPTINQQVFAAQ